MRTTLITSVFIFICAIQVGAADISTNKQGAGQNFEQKKAEIIQHIEKRIALSQEEKACVHVATTNDGIRACKEKFRPAPKADNRTRNQEN